MSHDVIVVGGGVNGLVGAAYLAKAGRRVLVVESRPATGGLAITEEVTPGFRFDVCGHDAGWVFPDIARDLGLASHGLELLVPEASVFAPQPDGKSLVLWTDPAKTAQEITPFSPADAERWPGFTAQLAKFARFLEAVYAITPPHVPDPGPADLLTLLGLGRRLRGLGGRDMIELLRVLPMSCAEWLDDQFQSDALKGAVGAGGITRILQGPRASGTAFVLLHHHVGRPAGHVRAAHLVKGGVGRLGVALAAAAKGFGAEIRTAAPVREIVLKDGRAAGVVLASGEQLAARFVVSSADPMRTFFGMVDAAALGPEFLRAVRNIKFCGSVATVNLGLAELPRFTARPGDGPHLRGAITIAPSLEYLERAYDDAKHGGVSRRPYLEARIPTLHDSTLAPSGKHIMTVQMQYAPYHLKTGTWDGGARDALADLVIDTLTEYAPNIKSAVLHRHVVTPKDLEERYGLTEGSAYHGELTLDQVFFMRPVAGWARYRTPIDGLYLCGAGTHPGGGLAGASGRNAARELLRERT
jgi:phytoene dehydrogenase-like protein